MAVTSYPGQGIQGNPAAPASAPAPIPPQPNTNPPQQGATIPFRSATDPKTIILQQRTLTLTAAIQQQGPDTINGEGFIEELGVRVQGGINSGNAATVAYTEDGADNALVQFVFNGPGGDIMNVVGESLAKYNRYDGKQVANYQSSTDFGVFAQVTGAGGTGGSIVQSYRLPMAIGYRNLVGILGNQDRATKYRLRADLNASTTIYSTPPTALPSVTTTIYYRERTVPGAADNFGNPQQQVPNGYGIIHYIFTEQTPNIPATGTIRHYMQGLGNTIRRIMLEFRQGASALRSAAEGLLNTTAATPATAPALITWFLGDNPLFVEDYALRRRIMFDRYGVDAPNGILIYDWANDFAPRSGEELGDDLLNTQNVVTLSVQVVYPATYTNAANSLTVLKDTLYVPSNVNLPSVMLAG